jgi:ABC-2 type transport system ATP-binding protein
MNGPPIIEAIDVSKHYGSLTAVDHLDMSVPPGVCFGLLGPNGAGKTTLIEIIEDIIPPSSGEVRYRGKPRASSFREEIGIMFQQTALMGFMTVYETLKTFHALYHHAHDIEALIDLCHLDDIRKQLNDRISGGQRQRLLLALALINQPQLLFLDEPSTGLDPQARRNLWDIVDRVKQDGKTIILTTHYMEEAQQLCDVVAVVDKGRIIAHGTPQELISLHAQGIRIILPEEAVQDKLAGIALETEPMDGRLAIHVKDMNTAIETFLDRGIDLTDMRVLNPTLETVFLNLTGRQLRD